MGMPDEVASPELTDGHLSVCLHCRKRADVKRICGANLCSECIEKSVRPRYDVERDPDHVTRQAQVRSSQVDADVAGRVTTRRAQGQNRRAEVSRIAKAKAHPEPVRSGSEVRSEARERTQAERVS